MNAVVTDNWIRRHRINVDEYYRMAEVGLLAPDARTELIEGEIIDMSPIGSTHAAVVGSLVRYLVHALQERALAEGQRPIRLDDQSEPQPDVVVLKARHDSYASGHPTPADVLLVIEVSDSTIRYDRDKKAPLYARAVIPEMWLIDVNAKVVHRFSEPRDGAYQSKTVLRGGSIQPLMLANVSVDLDKILSF